VRNGRPSAAAVSRKLLLDTHALLWLVNGEKLAEPAREAIRGAASASALFVSPISSWEIVTLIRKRRLALNRDVEDWFDGVLGIPGTALTELDWKTLVRSVTLPGDPPNDPADRILISTARRAALLPRYPGPRNPGIRASGPRRRAGVLTGRTVGFPTAAAAC
jgi:PIN domain nuclease of toxin-antitoxin system